MSASAIEAGRAFLKLLVDDNEFRVGLEKGLRQLNGFAKSAATIGAALGGAGAAITTPFIAALKVFSDTGSALADMKARTGLSAESMSVLKYAAEQTGTSLEAVEKAARELQDKGIDPNRIGEYAKKIAAIEDPTKRAQAAFELFGKKAGAAILPLLQNLPEFEEKARRLGLVWSQDMVENADALGDAVDTVKSQFLSLLANIGSAVAPVVTAAAGHLSKYLAVLIQFVKDHQEAVVAVAAVGAALVAIGATLGTVAASVAGLVGVMTALVAIGPEIIAALGIAGGVAATLVTLTTQLDFATSGVVSMTTHVLKLAGAFDVLKKAAAGVSKDLNDAFAYFKIMKGINDVFSKTNGGFAALANSGAAQTAASNTPVSRGANGLLFSEQGAFPSLFQPGFNFALTTSLRAAFAEFGRGESRGLKGFDTPAQNALDSFEKQTRPILGTFNGRLAGQIFGSAGNDPTTRIAQGVEKLVAINSKQRDKLEDIDRNLKLDRYRNDLA